MYGFSVLDLVGNNVSNTGVFGLLLALSPALSIFPCFVSKEVHKRLGHSMSRIADLNYQRNIPHHRIPCPVYKLEGLREGEPIEFWRWAGY